MRPRVWLNVDLGELPGEDEALYEHAHAANVACGGHAGDDDSMRRAVELCLRHGTLLGAHPSYPDRSGFGRTHMGLEAGALVETVRQQCLRLAEIGKGRGAAVVLVKPHGALYHDAHADDSIAEAVVRGALLALGPAVGVIGPSRGALARAADRAPVAFAREGFADRATRADGTLVPRGEPGAVLTDPASAAARAAELANAGAFDTLCVHGDTPGAAAIARAVRRVLDAS